MKRVCFSVYIKFIILLILAVIFMIISIITEKGIYIFLMFLFSFSVTLLRCSGCGKMLGTTKNGWTTLFFAPTCNKCGKNLLKCNEESKE